MAQQRWINLYGEFRRIDQPVAAGPREQMLDVLASIQNSDTQEAYRTQYEKMFNDHPAIKSLRPPKDAPLEFTNTFFTQCFVCSQLAIWIRDKIVYPESSYTITPNSDLPPDVRADFQEALTILPKSPRGAAALLRLAIERLCIYLGRKGKINEMIGELVTDGLSPKIQQALDIVRVIGNDAVHPGQIDLRDTPDVAEKLFMLVNLIAEKTISEPKHIEQLYSLLDPKKIEGIEQRDRKKLPPPKKADTAR